MTTQQNTVNYAAEDATNFRIYDLTGLSSAMREVAEIDAKQAEMDAVKAAEIERINNWHKAESDKLKGEREWREQQIIDYHQRRLAENPKDKTLSTPYGKIKSTTKKATFKKPDNDLLLAVLETNGYDDLIKEKVTRTPDWASYKKQLNIMGDKVVDENGVIVDDIEIEPATTTFKLEVE